MIVRKMLITAVCSVFSSALFSQEGKIVDVDNILFQYDINLDQEIVGASVGGENSAGMVIVKEYLNKRKAKVDPARSQKVEYSIIDGSHKTKFLTVCADADVEIGNIERKKGEYLIPVVDLNKNLDVYSYASGTQKVSKVDLSDNTMSAGDGLVSLYVDDIHVSSGSGSTISVVRASDGKHRSEKTVDVYEKKNFVLEVEDVTRIDDRLYMVGVGHAKEESNTMILWMASVELRSEAMESSSREVIINGSNVVELSFVNSNHSQPSILLVKTDDRYRNAEAYIFNADLEVKWKNDVSRIEGDQFTVAGVCNEEYLILEQIYGKSDKLGLLGIQLVAGSGEVLDAQEFRMVENGSLREVKAVPDNKSVYVYTNFSKIEDERRADGWYSWNGYRIDLFELVCGNED